MHFGYLYKCDSCGREDELCSSGDDGGRCSCGGQYHKIGETYDQEWVDEQRYNEQQDREYKYRHRNDRW